MLLAVKGVLQYSPSLSWLQELRTDTSKVIHQPQTQGFHSRFFLQVGQNLERTAWVQGQSFTCILLLLHTDAVKGFFTLQGDLCPLLGLPSSLGSWVIPQGRCSQGACTETYFFHFCAYHMPAKLYGSLAQLEVAPSHTHLRLSVNFCSLHCAKLFLSSYYTIQQTTDKHTYTGYWCVQWVLVCTLNFRVSIRESVDSLCRDGADAQYMQYLSKSHITSPQIR